MSQTKRAKKLLVELFSFCPLLSTDSFKSSDGIYHSEEGRLKRSDSETEAIAVQGTYSYQHEGVTYTIDYVADELGFRVDEPIC